MSVFAPAWYVEKYRRQVLHKFQSAGNKTMGTTTGPDRIEGKKMHFPIAGVGEAHEMKQGSDLKPMNAPRSTQEIEPKAWQAPDYVYQVDLDRMTANEVDATIRTGAMALGRRYDRVVIGACAAATIPNEVGDYANPWTLQLALEACDALQDQDVPWDGNIFCPLPSRAWNQMMTYKQFTNSDYVGPMDLPFTKATDRKTWNGVHWYIMENKALPLSGTNRDFFIWHRSAVGSGFNGDSLNVRITWENIKTAWLINQWIDIGATVLLPEGVVKCKMKSDSPIPAPN